MATAARTDTGPATAEKKCTASAQTCVSRQSSSMSRKSSSAKSEKSVFTTATPSRFQYVLPQQTAVKASMIVLVDLYYSCLLF